jgi:4-diphosphocytidyl-2-C-methyl-D-erythritol kinase
MSAPPADPTGRLMPVVRVAPAKLNLTLAVVGRRPDGYHSLHSVMVPLALADRLSLSVASGRSDTLHVDGIPTGAGSDDLVLQAFAEARLAVGAGWAGPGRPPPAIAARLEKRIPVAAGLAGGSSDAAAALDGVVEAWAAELSIEARSRVAARLGSDVPFFLARGPALVEGRGETVTPLQGVVGPPPGVLLFTPPVGVLTPAVFAAYDAGARPSGAATQTSSLHLAEELRAGLDSRALVDRAGILAVANDLILATAAVVPAMVELRRALRRCLERPVGQSGSGPTLWVLYPSLADAESAAATVRAAVADGSLHVPGYGEPFIAATTIQPRSER